METTNRIRIGLIGYGYWGPNIARNLTESDFFDLVLIADSSEAQRLRASKKFPLTSVVESADYIINDPTIDAVAIVTPPESHFDLARACLEAGKHVLVEKPVTTKASDALQLINIASANNLTIMVDHTFVYSPPVGFIRKYIKDGNLGSIHSFDSKRINLGLIQKNSDVLWDLAVHDLSILNSIVPDLPKSVSASGAYLKNFEQAVTGYMTLFYESGFIAHIGTSWMSPIKIRQTIISGDSKMLVYDDLDTVAKVKIYDSSATISDDPSSKHNVLVSYRTGDIISPLIPQDEALSLVVKAFYDSVKRGINPLSSARESLRIINILEAASESLLNKGDNVEIAYSI
jgi:predicted dehydrogenase